MCDIYNNANDTHCLGTCTGSVCDVSESGSVLTGDTWDGFQAASSGYVSEISYEVFCQRTFDCMCVGEDCTIDTETIDYPSSGEFTVEELDINSDCPPVVNSCHECHETSRSAIPIGRRIDVRIRFGACS